MTIKLCGTDIYYEQHGSGAPLLLLHGWGCDVGIWAALVRDLAPYRQITLLDFPGHGLSPEPPEPWSVGEYTELTARFIEKLGLVKPDIIAHSFGGRVAVMLSGTRPELVGKLIITGGAGFVDKNKKPGARSTQYKLLRSIVDNALICAVVGESGTQKMRQLLRQKYGSADYRALKTDRMRATFNRVIAQDLEPYLKDIAAPTLLVYGSNDTATPVWMGQLMEREIKDAGLIVLEGGTHYAFLEQYQTFLAIVKNFLKIS